MLSPKLKDSAWKALATPESTLKCDSATPLGLPVVPEEWMSTAGSSGWASVVSVLASVASACSRAAPLSSSACHDTRPGAVYLERPRGLS